MPSFVRGVVLEVLSERPGLQRVLLRPDDADGAAPGERAYVLTQLTGPVAVGDDVLANTTAVELRLGTGGWHVVHANLSRGGWSAPGGGHVVKLRYTSLQVDTGAHEEHDGATPTDLGGVPVVACTLHSQVAVVAAAAKATLPALRVVYVMTDGAALPIALSDLVADLRAHALLDGTVTAGHAFGGDHEAVAVPSALTIARHELGADLVIAGMGPGVVGTASALGTTAVEAVPTLTFAAALGGKPVLCVRASSGDLRPRHRGVSHHALTVLSLLPVPVDVPVPASLLAELAEAEGRHNVLPLDPPDPAALLAAAGIEVTTMGRGPADDPLFFATAAAAGIHAATLAQGPI